MGPHSSYLEREAGHWGAMMNQSNDIVTSRLMVPSSKPWCIAGELKQQTDKFRLEMITGLDTAHSLWLYITAQVCSLYKRQFTHPC